MNKQIYIIDDDNSVRKSLERLLSDEDYKTESFPATDAFKNKISKETAGILLLDVNLPGTDGLSFLKELKKNFLNISVIMITGEATIDRAVAATKLGAYDFLEKPLNPAKLLLSLRNLVKSQQLYQQLQQNRKQEDAVYEIIGQSEAVYELHEQIKQIAPADTTILITGENGTGKELAAYQIWVNSHRRDNTYVKVNCAALPEELAESELFGHRKGAFTGAERNREGKFKTADGGTIFLDEIGDLSPAIQAKLLRILENGELEPLGADKIEKVDVRVITATNRDLKDLISKGKFREDLFYRLNVIPLELPALCNRREDIPLLVEHFNNKLITSTGLGVKQFSSEVVGYLSGLDYPGNVRELRNIVERCFIMTRGNEIELEDVRKYIGGIDETEIVESSKSRNKLAQAVQNFEKSYLSSELAKFEGNISELARALGIDRGNLSKKLKNLNIV